MYTLQGKRFLRKKLMSKRKITVKGMKVKRRKRQRKPVTLAATQQVVITNSHVKDRLSDLAARIYEDVLSGRELEDSGQYQIEDTGALTEPLDDDSEVQLLSENEQERVALFEDFEVIITAQTVAFRFVVSRNVIIGEDDEKITIPLNVIELSKSDRLLIAKIINQYVYNCLFMKRLWVNKEKGLRGYTRILRKDDNGNVVTRTKPDQDAYNQLGRAIQYTLTHRLLAA